MDNSLFVDSGRVIYTKQISTSSRKWVLSAKEGANKISYPIFWKYSEVCGIINEEETQDPATQTTTTYTSYCKGWPSKNDGIACVGLMAVKSATKENWIQILFMSI